MPSLHLLHCLIYAAGVEVRIAEFRGQYTQLLDYRSVRKTPPGHHPDAYGQQPVRYTVPGIRAGQVTSAIYSPRLQANIALAMVQIEHSAIDTRVEVGTPGASRSARIVRKPFYDPAKNLAKS